MPYRPTRRTRLECRFWHHRTRTERALRGQNEGVIEADRQPSVLARMLGSMLQKAREVVGLSYGEAAAWLGCEADWLVRVETGFALAPPEEVARILVEYGVREAKVADEIIDMARRVAAPPPWLARHTSRLSAAARDVLLVEAEATLAQVQGFRLIPSLAQAEGYFREIAPKLFPGCDVDQEWDLLAPPGAPARRGDPAPGGDHRRERPRPPAQAARGHGRPGPSPAYPG
jgi:hypothetical protein